MADDLGLAKPVVARRAVTYLGWLLGFLALVALIGMLPTVFAFVVLYMRLEGDEKWRLTLTIAAGMTTFAFVVFERLLHLPWPQTVVGGWFPALKDLIPSM